MKKSFDQVLKALGVYETKEKNVLFIAKGGYVASDAWMVSDGQFNQIAGRKFGVLTEHDNQSGWVDKSNIRRFKNESEFQELLAAANPIFKKMIELWDNDVEVIDRYEFGFYQNLDKRISGTTKRCNIYAYHAFYKDANGTWVENYVAEVEYTNGTVEKIFDVDINTLESIDEALVRLSVLDPDHDESKHIKDYHTKGYMIVFQLLS